MKTKMMLYGGLFFLIVGFTTGNNMLYYFFAVHMLTLALVFFLYKRELKHQRKHTATKESKRKGAR